MQCMAGVQHSTPGLAAAGAAQHPWPCSGRRSTAPLALQRQVQHMHPWPCSGRCSTCTQRCAAQRCHGTLRRPHPAADMPPPARACLCLLLQIVTMDATEAGGAPPECADNVRAAFTHLFSLAGSAEGLVQLRKAFRLCDELAGQEDATTLAYWVQVGRAGAGRQAGVCVCCAWLQLRVLLCVIGRQAGGSCSALLALHACRAAGLVPGAASVWHRITCQAAARPLAASSGLGRPCSCQLSTPHPIPRTPRHPPPPSPALPAQVPAQHVTT
jgi:hypothetical protein